MKEQLKDILEVINFFKEDQDRKDEHVKARIDHIHDVGKKGLE